MSAAEEFASAVTHTLPRAPAAGSLCRFDAAADLALDVLEENVTAKVANICAAGWLGTADAAKLGYLLNRLLARSGNTTEKRFTLFANSTLEALYAVIRLCRQVAKDKGRPGARKVLIYDRELQYQRFFDPLGKGPGQALCPEIYCVESEARWLERLELDRQSWACIIWVVYPGQSLKDDTRARIDALSRETGSLNVVCNSEKALSDESLFRIPDNTHVVIFGENLTGHQVPFGAFSLVAPVYSVWGTRRSLVAYTSTFAGNATALSAAVHALARSASYINDVDRRVFAQIDASFDERIRYFNSYVHPAFGELFAADKKDLDVVLAEGNSLVLANGREIIDLSTLGCSLRGHNPGTVLEDVITKYDRDVDYFAAIEKRLREMSAFSHLLPSVSGAGAVDSAIVMALLARPDRPKIISFVGNYAGKTLTSVNFSKTAPLLADFDLPAFEPYYGDVIYIDPFAAGAEEEFVRQVRGGGVALVWFELVQGYMLKRVPDSLVRTVERYKGECGYLIGVDEVLTGMWKSGRTLLLHQGCVSGVDIVTMSKATSDMLFPVSWALVTDDVFREASATDESVVRLLQKFYRNNLGGLVALNALETGRRFFETHDLTDALQTFHAAIQQIVAKSSLFSGITTTGSLLRLHLNKDWFPYTEGSIEATLAEGAVSKLLLSSTGVLVTYLRIFLPCIHSAELHAGILRRLRVGVAKITPSTVYAYMLCQSREMLDALGMTKSFKQILLDAMATA
jgi:acetylornithine/succinyldiaminopimelate/putrescine aminotransferase